MENKSGKVWLVGAGPGDAGLFTLKGKSVLNRADVVVYDKLVGQGILNMIPGGTERIFVGKMSGNHPVPQQEINEILLREAQMGKNVARLKGGDPFVFGRGGEELELLHKNNIPFEVVPGITSAVAVPAYNGIPVTHRDFVSSLHIITGHTKKEAEADIDYEALVRLKGTLVFLMGVAAMPKICKSLLAAGMEPDMPAAILERGTKAHQRRVVASIGTLPLEAEKAGIKTPAIIVVGKVCSLEKEFNWAETRPLGRLVIAVTRPRSRSSYLAEKLAFLGAEIVSLPTIETRELENNNALSEALIHIDAYDWAVFTSPQGVEIFFNRLKAMGLDVRALGSLKFAAIGPATKAAIEARGILVALMPEVYSGKALGEMLAEQVNSTEMLAGKEFAHWGAHMSGGRDAGPKGRCKILIPRAQIGTEEVIKPIADKRLDYVDLPIYETLQPELLCEIPEDMDYVAFTSASTVHGFVKGWKDGALSKIKAVCIGESTAKAAREYGMETWVAEEATMDSMIECFLRLAKAN